MIEMGTNYYWIDNPDNFDEMDPRIHIGKRSAAGRYCYDCGIYLTAQSTQYAHMGKRDEFNEYINRKFDVCPNCGKGPSDEFIAADRELFRGTPVPSQLHGVQGVSSFTWTMVKHKTDIVMWLKTDKNKKIIRNEYGDEFSADEFLGNELRHCIILFQMYAEFS